MHSGNRIEMRCKQKIISFSVFFNRVQSRKDCEVQFSLIQSSAFFIIRRTQYFHEVLQKIHCNIKSNRSSAQHGNCTPLCCGKLLAHVSSHNNTACEHLDIILRYVFSDQFGHQIMKSHTFHLTRRQMSNITNYPILFKNDLHTQMANMICFCMGTKVSFHKTFTTVFISQN